MRTCCPGSNRPRARPSPSLTFPELWWMWKFNILIMELKETQEMWRKWKAEWAVENDLQIATHEMIRYHSFDHLGLPVIRAHQGCHRKLAGCDVTHAGSVEHQDSRRKGKLERLGKELINKWLEKQNYLEIAWTKAANKTSHEVSSSRNHPV